MPGQTAMFLLTGPSAAGKSIIGRLLAERFPRGVHVEGDVFRRSVVSGRAEITPEPSEEALSQLRLRYRLAALVADTYFGAGFTVVWEDVIAGPLLEECTELIRSRPLHVVVLLPTTQALSERDASRPDTGYAEWSVQKLHEVFANETPRLGHWLDTSHQSPHETVGEILRLTASV
jgi:chloramphenicol 3-O-phosphotransferase